MRCHGFGAGQRTLRQATRVLTRGHVFGAGRTALADTSHVCSPQGVTGLPLGRGAIHVLTGCHGSGAGQAALIDTSHMRSPWVSQVYSWAGGSDRCKPHVFSLGLPGLELDRGL